MSIASLRSILLCEFMNTEEADASEAQFLARALRVRVKRASPLWLMAFDECRAKVFRETLTLLAAGPALSDPDYVMGCLYRVLHST